MIDMGDFSDNVGGGGGSSFYVTTGGGGGSSSATNCVDYWTYPMTTWTYPVQERCKYCDGLACKTAERCPRVKKIEYYKDGSVSKIEFHKA